MKVSKKGEFLHINSGMLHPDYELPIIDIISWEFVAEENGATYFTFKYSESTQHVSIPKMEPAELLRAIESIQAILGQQPKLSISEIRITKEQLWLATDVSIGLLGLVLASASI
jgi:hypothetical protein